MVFNAFERMVALRYLRARRQEGFISVIAGFSLLGIALGVATLIIVMAVMNGFRQELFARILGVNGHLTVYAQSGSIGNFDPLAEKLGNIPGVVATAPQIQGEVMITAGETATGALVRAIRPETLSQRRLVVDNIVAGSTAGFDAGEEVLIGIHMARRLGVSVGDRITLALPRGNPTGLGMVPRLKSYNISGLFQVGMYEYDSGFIYVPLAAAQLFFRLRDQVNAVELFLEGPDFADTVTLETTRRLGPGYRIVDWQRANRGIKTAIEVERNVMFIILTLIIVVAAFNIISGQIMLVKDKGRDIAILRTMGATSGMVMRVFLLCGGSIGVVGTLLGFLLGISFAANIETIRRWLENLIGIPLFDETIYFLSQLPAEIDPYEVVAVIGMSLILSFLATLYPSWRASRLDPVEALRYE